MWQLGEDGGGPEWRVVETPFDISLFGVAQTSEGAYAVGSGGHLVADRGDGWEIIFDDGPNTRDNQLRAMDVTDDGERVWMLGSSGAIACYDVQERKKFDYSYPEEMTSTWEGITVSGDRGKEKALAANGSGEILPFTIDGFDVDWGQLDKPAGQGSKMAALASTPDGVGFAVDTSGNAFKTTADEGWTDIGIVNAQVKFYDIYAGENQRVYVAAGDGRIYRYDDSYHNWTPIGVAEKTSLQAFDVYETDDGRKEMVVLGADGSIFQRTGKERWEKVPSPTKSSLNSLRLGDPDVAVGKNGVVVERPRGEPRDAGTSADGDEFDGRGENYDGDDTGQSEDPENADSDGSDESDETDTGAESDEGAAASTATDDPDASGDESDAEEGETDPDDDPDGDDVDSDDTDSDETAGGDDSDETDADDDDNRDGASAADAGISRWSDPPSSDDGGDSSVADALSEATAQADADTSEGTTAQADADTSAEATTQADADASAETAESTDAETKENVLVAIAERTELDAVDVTEAAEHGSDIIESVLVEIADDVGIDPGRVRDALNRSPESAETAEPAE